MSTNSLVDQKISDILKKVYMLKDADEAYKVIVKEIIYDVLVILREINDALKEVYHD